MTTLPGALSPCKITQSRGYKCDQGNKLTINTLVHTDTKLVRGLLLRGTFEYRGLLVGWGIRCGGPLEESPHDLTRVARPVC